VTLLRSFAAVFQEPAVIKTDCWHIRDRALLRAAFPAAP